MASHVVLLEQLLEMGFSENLIKGALSILKDKATLESVIEAIDNGTAEKQAEKLQDEPEPVPKELTEEEKEAQKKVIEEKLKQRRAEIVEKEKEAERQREIQRRKDGKDMGKMREELEQLQRQRLAESIKKEKDEAKAARDAILRQIELDKAERRAKNAPAPSPAATTTTTTSNYHASSANVSKEGKTKLAIRLLDGSQLIQEFDSKEILSSVRAYIVTQKNIDYNITFAMPPKPAFAEDDMEKPLHALGLVPTARIHVVRR